MQKHLKGSHRAAAYIKLLEILHVRAVWGLTSVLEEMLHLSSLLLGTCQDFVTNFASSCCELWGPVLVLREGIASPERCGEGWKRKVLQSTGGGWWNQGVLGCVWKVQPGKSIRNEPGLVGAHRFQLGHPCSGCSAHSVLQLSLWDGIWAPLLHPCPSDPISHSTACLLQALTFCG